MLLLLPYCDEIVKGQSLKVNSLPRTLRPLPDPCINTSLKKKMFLERYMLYFILIFVCVCVYQCIFQKL